MTEDQKEKLYGIVGRVVTDIERGVFEESAELESFIDELIQSARMEGAIIGNTLAELNRSSSENP